LEISALNGERNPCKPQKRALEPDGFRDILEASARAMTESATPRPAYARVTRNHKGVDAEGRRLERRHRLIEAGLATLGVKGYHATTVRDICGAAGLSERYFYESFSGLSELFDTIYQQLHEELLGRLMSILISSRTRQAPTQDTVKLAMSAWFAFLKEDPRRARIMLIDAMGANANSMSGAQQAARDYVGAIQAFIDLLYPGLADLGMQSRLMGAIVTGACIHAAKEWMWTDFETPMETVVHHMCVVFEALDQHYKLMRKAKTSGT
jgi:AcrR family transcriptional regulator